MNQRTPHGIRVTPGTAPPTLRSAGERVAARDPAAARAALPDADSSWLMRVEPAQHLNWRQDPYSWADASFFRNAPASEILVDLVADMTS
jgi:hypothetical protein